jgi:hypothetical protein
MITVLSSHAHRGRRCRTFVEETPVPREERTARLTILVDPRKKAVFERLCAEEDLTPSQLLRRLIRDYIEARTGKPWQAEERARTVTARRRA